MNNWRFIDFNYYEAAHNMAFDEAIANTVIEGHVPPTLRLYGWKTKSVSIGAFQKMHNINVELCNQKNIPIVRRPTGGRAILHNIELTYSFSSPKLEGFFTDKLLDNYKALNTAFLQAFQALGIPAKLSQRRLKRKELTQTPLCFASTSFSEITVKDKKVMGSAQKRFPNGFLQQGSIMLMPDRPLTQAIFKQYEHSMAGLTEFLPAITIDILSLKVKEAFENTFNIKFHSQDQYHPVEEACLDRLLAKYQYH